MDTASTPYLLRPVRESDLDCLHALAASVKGGLTTLPADPRFLENKIIESTRAFDPRVRKPAGEYYLFVLEDTRAGRAVGTAGAIACVGGFEPFYSYEIRTERFSHPPLGIEKQVEVLHLQKNHRGPAEVCSLYLHPEHRRGGIGRLLSLGRFLFMRTFPERFDDDVIAELRGWLDDDDNSPFWDAVGRHFFEKDYTTADFLSGLGNKAFIEALMPRYPIYLTLLPPAVQAVIGKVHRDTEPALRLLLEEGFHRTREIDIFDAGPIVRAPLETIRTVRQTTRRSVHECTAVEPEAPAQLLARPSLDFRACLAPAAIRPNGSAVISRHTADLLGIHNGDTILIAAPRGVPPAP